MTPISPDRDTRVGPRLRVCGARHVYRRARHASMCPALSLVTIFIDHVRVPPWYLTYKFPGFSRRSSCSPGISVTLAYGKKFQPGNRLLATLKMWRRAGVLYAAHIVTTMVVMAIFCAAFRQATGLTMINIGR